eukprot:3293098-Amphidinium_carterae.3
MELSLDTVLGTRKTHDAIQPGVSFVKCWPKTLPAHTSSASEPGHSSHRNGALEMFNCRCQFCMKIAAAPEAT